MRKLIRALGAFEKGYNLAVYIRSLVGRASIF
jgi:hypothetical protein